MIPTFEHNSYLNGASATPIAKISANRKLEFIALFSNVSTADSVDSDIVRQSFKLYLDKVVYFLMKKLKDHKFDKASFELDAETQDTILIYGRIVYYI